MARTPVVDPRVAQARLLGREAFLAGRRPVPILDPMLAPLLVGNDLGEGIVILTAWTRGWHEANAAAPVPDAVP